MNVLKQGFSIFFAHGPLN